MNRFNIIPVVVPQNFIDNVKRMISEARGEGETRGEAVALVSEEQKSEEFEVIVLSREVFSRLVAGKAQLKEIEIN